MTMPEQTQQATKAKRRRPKKKRTWKYVLGGILAFIGLIFWWGTQPLTGTMHVGVCRTFAELNMLFPPTMEITAAYQFERSQRLFVNYIDGFGHDNAKMIDCRFVNGLKGNDYRLEKVTIDRRVVSDEIVERFNQTIPAIIAGDPDLVIPRPPSTDLKKLRTGP